MEAGSITREELYELVWAMPMIKVAEKFQVSGSYLARVCTALQVPRPERGYWAKLAVGKASKAPPLPEAQPGDPMVWMRADGLPVPSVPKPTIMASPQPRAKRPLRPVTGTHGLIQGAKEHFLAGRKVEKNEHLKPYKKLLVDVTASEACLDKALDFANKLFNALESAGYRVLLAPYDAQFRRERVYEQEVPPPENRRSNSYSYHNLWQPNRPTAVYVGTLAFGLSIVEMTESVEVRYVNGSYVRVSELGLPRSSRRYDNHGWTSTQDLPSGRLRLIIYAPYSSITWSTAFQETKKRSLKSDIPQIIKTLKSSVPIVIEQLQEAERQAEIRRQEWRAAQLRAQIEEDCRREAQSIKDSREHLDQVIQAWAKASSLEQFFKGVEDQAANLPEHEREAVMSRLALARDFVGTQNPLVFFLGWKTPLERYVPLAQRQKEDGAADGEGSSGE